GQRQLREHSHCDTVVVALPGESQHRRGVGRGVADRGVMRARGNPGKPLVVDVVEVHGPPIVACPRSFSGYWAAALSSRDEIRTLEQVTAERAEAPELVA